MADPDNHGGARNGAGRPKVHDEDLVKKSVMCPESINKLVQAEADHYGTTWSRRVVEILRDRLKPNT